MPNKFKPILISDEEDVLDTYAGQVLACQDDEGNTEAWSDDDLIVLPKGSELQKQLNHFPR